MKKGDKHLGMDRQITRRDLLNGVSVAIGASTTGGRLTAESPEVRRYATQETPEDYSTRHG